MIWPQTMECQEQLEAGRGKEEFSEGQTSELQNWREQISAVLDQQIRSHLLGQPNGFNGAMFP